MINPSEVPPARWIYGVQVHPTWEGLPLQLGHGETALPGESTFGGTEKPSQQSPTPEPFVRGVGGEEKACSLPLTFLDTDSQRPPPLQQQSRVICQEELCSRRALWPRFLCGLRFLPFARCSSEGNQRVN